MVQMGDVVAWCPSSVDELMLQGCVGVGQLSAISDPSRPEWVVPPPSHQTPNPPEGFVVSFVRLHERGFNAPAGKFLRANCRCSE